MTRRVCILGVHHLYQFYAPRKAYLNEVRALIEIHSVDLVAEEATGLATTYVQEELLKPEFTSKVSWKNVDLSREERQKIPDINEMGIGTLVDFEHHELREWIWVVRTAAAMKNSALLICGMVHTFSVAAKFRSVGFEVETNVYFDKADDDMMKVLDKVLEKIKTV
jgi:hypothetical protein